MDLMQQGRDLIEKSARSGAQLIQSEMTLCFTLCDLVETDLRLERRGDALKALRKVQHEVASIRKRLTEPQHVLPDFAEEIVERLARVETRMHSLEPEFGEDGDLNPSR